MHAFFPEAGISKNYRVKNSGSPEIELKPWPWLIFKYWTGWPDLGSSLCPHNVYDISLAMANESRGRGFLGTSLLLCPSKMFKGTVSWEFLLLVFFMNKFPPGPRASHLDCFECFWKFAIFASQGAPPVSMTPVANFAISFTSIVDTGGNLRPLSTTPASNFPPILMTLVENNGNNIRLLRS